MSENKLDEELECSRLETLLKEIELFPFPNCWKRRNAALLIREMYKDHYQVFHDQCGGLIVGHPDSHCSECGLAVQVVGRSVAG